MNEPANVFLLEEIGRMTGCEVQVVCATAKDIQATLETHLPSANVFVIDDIIDDIDAGELSLIEEQGRGHHRPGGGRRAARRSSSW